MELQDIEFRVPAPNAVAAVYADLLGMSETESGDGFRFTYEGAATGLIFESGPSMEAGPSDGLYWKIGITLRDLDHAVRWLRSRGCDVSEPRQFRDIGYLCHLRDPFGHSIELLQQGFEGRATPAGGGHPIGGQATLAHLTFRARNLAAAEAVLVEEFGLAKVSRQPVPDHGFDLHFFSGQAETGPSAPVREAREWLWRRPYAMIEVQHLHDAPPLPNPGRSGFVGVTFSDGQKLDAKALTTFN